MKELSGKIYDIIIKYKYLFLVFSLLLNIGTFTGINKLSLAIGPEVWFPKNSDILNELDEFARLFGNDESVVIAVHSKNGIFTPEAIKVVDEVTENLWQVQDILRVESLINYNHSYTEDDEIIIEPLFSETKNLTNDILTKKEKTALDQDQLVGRLISKDAKTTLIFGHLKPFFKERPDHKKIDTAVKKLLEPYQSEEIKIYITGTIAITAEGRDVVFSDLNTFTPLLLLMILILLVFYFRSVVGVLVPIVIVVSTLITSFGIMGHLGLQFNTLTFVTPMSLMAIAIADSIHFIATYYRNRKEQNKHDALRNSFIKNFYPTLLTSITTSIGFFSLLTADLLPIKTLGIVSGIGTLMAWFLTIIILPPLMNLFASEQANSRSFQFNIHLIEKVVDFLLKTKIPLILFFSIVLVFTTYLTSISKVNYNFFAGLKKQVQVTRANQFLLDNFGGALGPELIIDSGEANGVKNPVFLRKVEALQQWITKLPEVNSASSFVNIVKRMNSVLEGDKTKETIPELQSTVAELHFLYTLGLPQGMNINHMMSLDQRKIRMSVLWTIQSALESEVRVKEIEQKAKELGLNAFVTGRVKLYQTINDTIVNSLMSSMGIALFCITLFITIFLRSLSIGLFSLIPNLFPLLVGLSYLKLTNHDIDSGVVVVLSVCLGIAVDDTLHFLTHFLEGREKNLTLRENFISVLHGTGNSLIITTVVLCLGFGIFAFSNHITNSNFGILSAIILACALVFDLVLLPTLIMATNKFLKFEKVQ